MATFTFNDQDVTIVNNHFTSKGGSAPLYGSDQPPFNAGEVSRAAQAQAVNNFVDNMLAADPNAKVIVAGDLNEFPSEEPMAVLRGEATISNYDVPGFDPFFASADYTPGGTSILNDLLELLAGGPALRLRVRRQFADPRPHPRHRRISRRTSSSTSCASTRNSPTRPAIMIRWWRASILEAPVVPALPAPDPARLGFRGRARAIDDAPRFAAIVDRLEDLQANSITLASGDNYIPSPFFNASSDPALDPFFEESVGRADIRILNTIGFEASVIGNHEFDQGPREVQNLIRPVGAGTDGGGAYEGTRFGYLAANLDFSGEPDLAPNAGTTPVTEATFGTGASGGRRLGPSMILEENGELIGVVGVTTPVFEDITTPAGCGSSARARSTPTTATIPISSHSRPSCSSRSMR